MSQEVVYTPQSYLLEEQTLEEDSDDGYELALFDDRMKHSEAGILSSGLGRLQGDESASWGFKEIAANEWKRRWSSPDASSQGVFNYGNADDMVRSQMEVLRSERDRETAHPLTRLVDHIPLIKNFEYGRWYGKKNTQSNGSILRLVSSSGEPSWNSSDSSPRWSEEPLFAVRPRLTPFPITSSEDFTKQQREYILGIANQVSVGVNTCGTGVSVGGLGAPLVYAVTPKHWLSDWRCRERKLLAPKHYSWQPGLEARLKELDEQLFDVKKYNSGTCNYITVMTYTEEDNGSISLFEAWLDFDTLQASSLQMITGMTEVPRSVLRTLRSQVAPNRIDLRFRSPRPNPSCRNNGQQTLPWLTLVKTRPGIPWQSSGWGWRRALGLIDGEPRDKLEGLTATIPQMMAFLHLKMRFMTKLQSSKIITFYDPLILDASPPSNVVNVKRGVKLLGAPEGNAHIGGDVRVVVFFPRDSAWATENLFWA